MRCQTAVIRFLFCALLINTLLVNAHTAQALGMYYRYASAPAATCGYDGLAEVNLSSVQIEFLNLPAGAQLVEIIVINGVATQYGPFPLTPGSDSFSYDMDQSAPGYPFTFQFIAKTLIEGVVVYISTLSGTCTAVGPTTVTLTNGSAFGAFGGPALPEKHNLVLISADTPVYDGPGGKPLATGQALAACQTVYLIDTSEDGAWGQIFVMGGWIPLSTTTDVAESYGQPGGQPTLPRCVGK
jgi:hypothetical protein